MVEIHGYFLLRNDRTLCLGVGVACFVKNLFKSTIILMSPNLTLNEPEFMIVKIILPNQDSILLATLYRRPKGILLNKFINVFNIYYTGARNVIITGDLNCDLLSHTFEANYLRDIAASLALKIIPHKATHHTAISDTWLDVILTSDIEKIVSHTKSNSLFIAGHDLISVTYNVTSKPPIERWIQRREYYNIDTNKFNELVRANLTSLCDKFSSTTISIDISNIISDMQLHIINSLDKLAPLKRFK